MAAKASKEQSQTGLRLLFVDAFRFFEPRRPQPEIDVRYYPYAGLHHTIRLRSGKIYVRLSDILRDAPLNIHRALAFVLIAKLLRRTPLETHKRCYRDYSLMPDVVRQSELARRRRGRKQISTAVGSTYDLDRMFDKINRKFFSGELPKPTLTWSRTRTRRILGHHDPAHDTLVISKTLDSIDVPAWVVEYILFHEMLHIKHPARIIDGRRVFHTKAFRLEERRHPHYEEAQNWLDRFAHNRRTAQAA